MLILLRVREKQFSLFTSNFVRLAEQEIKAVLSGGDTYLICGNVRQGELKNAIVLIGK